MTLVVMIPFRYNTKDTIHEEIIEKLDFIKIKKFCYMKDSIKRIRR